MSSLKTLLNHYGKRREPIFFVIDFEAKAYFVKPLEILDEDILYCLESCAPPLEPSNNAYTYEPVSYERYKQAFEIVQEEIKSGNSYLLNLAFASKLNIDLSLKEIYLYAHARFKLYFKDQFTCFSPERFINIVENKIYAYPMKGTIDASIPQAESKILNNQKEMAEHVMVVDLLRNDLGMVAKKIRVEKFRYVEKIKAGKRELLQVSSQISGDLAPDWQESLGDILTTLLPAGSITGTPKKSTTKIIKNVEEAGRGFFSGIFGVFDGKSVDSAVMIRFIEKTDEGLFYKSGGGITLDSKCKEEYLEMCEKVYVPFF